MSTFRQACGKLRPHRAHSWTKKNHHLFSKSTTDTYKCPGVRKFA